MIMPAENEIYQKNKILYVSEVFLNTVYVKTVLDEL